MKLKQNLELKHYCDNFQEIRKILKKIGAKKDKVIKGSNIDLVLNNKK